ncbi:diguanylate cyclase/phosphodiesterase [Glaciecola sp. KUL10]|nr:diguanylate cyclase/phosphodiesterase [Glaciecola sp. KUL10]
MAVLINLKSSKAILLLDDFGLENASLNLISIGLFDRVAVCESLLNDIQQLNCKIVVSAITALCGANNIDVIAKQSDCSADRRKSLQNLGFHYVQETNIKGFQSFSKAIS